MYGTDVVQDDQIWIEADILVADHPNVTSGDVISVTFAIKVSWARVCWAVLGVSRACNISDGARENINKRIVNGTEF